MTYARGHRRVAVAGLRLADRRHRSPSSIVPQLVNIIIDTVVGGIQADSNAEPSRPRCSAR